MVFDNEINVGSKETKTKQNKNKQNKPTNKQNKIYKTKTETDKNLSAQLIMRGTH